MAAGIECKCFIICIGLFYTIVTRLSVVVYYFVGKECVREKKKKKSSFYLNGDSLEWKHSRILSVNRYKKKK